MITRLAGRDVYVGVISFRRPEKVQHMPIQATWHVPLSDHPAYAEAGAPALMVDPGRGPSPARNTVLDQAQILGVDALVMDDDPTKGGPKLAVHGLAVPISPLDALKIIVRQTLDAGASLGTNARMQNALWQKGKPDVKPDPMVRGWIMYVPHGPSSVLRFDEKITYAEDFEFGIQHYVLGAGVARCDNVMWQFEVGNEGGLTEEQGLPGRRTANEYIVKKWGNFVSVNKDEWLRFAK